MTIAAGFVLTDGILLCADTLYEDGYTKEYRDKIFLWTDKGASVSFALAGHASIGKMAVDDCIEALSACPKERLSIADALKIVRPILKTTHEQYVEARPFEYREISRFSLLVAVCALNESPRLYLASDAAFERVHSFDCVGVGRQLGRYIIEPMFQSSMNINQAVPLAIQALASAKERVDGVGGKSQFIAIRRNGPVSDVVPHDVNLTEPLVLEYQRRAAGLLLAAADSQIDETEFKKRKDSFGTYVQELRAKWKERSFAWQLLMHELAHFSEIREAIAVLEATTDDRQRQPPSPG